VLVDEITGERFRVTEQRLVELSDLMLQAENLKRRGEWRHVYDIWRRVGEFFLEHKDTNTALYYYGKAQNVAKQSADMVLEARAYEDVGRVYARLGRLQEAMKAHEAQLSLADAHREEEETRAARKKLVFIYLEMAKQCLTNDEKARTAQNNLNATTTSTLRNSAMPGVTNISANDKYAITPAKSQAIKFLERAYRTAKQSEDPELQSQTAAQLGETHESVRDFDSAIKYQQIYLDLSEKQQNVPGMASAYKHLGKLYELDGDAKSALKIYNRFMTYAEQSGDIRILGEACEHIGLSLNSMGKYEKAIKFFERNFQLSQASGETEWINKARIHLGFAKGDAAMKGFVNLIQNDDVDQLIRWKDKRDPHTLHVQADEDGHVDDSESISSLDDEQDPLRRSRHLDQEDQEQQVEDAHNNERIEEGDSDERQEEYERRERYEQDGELLQESYGENERQERLSEEDSYDQDEVEQDERNEDEQASHSGSSRSEHDEGLRFTEGDNQQDEGELDQERQISAKRYSSSDGEQNDDQASYQSDGEQHPEEDQDDHQDSSSDRSRNQSEDDSSSQNDINRDDDDDEEGPVEEVTAEETVEEDEQEVRSQDDEGELRG